VTLDAGAESAANDIRAEATAPYVIVAHSAGAIVAPAVAARLGADVRHIVLVAGLAAPHGMAVVDAVFPDRKADLATQWAILRVSYAGHTFARKTEASVNADDGLVVLTEPMVARNIDSLNMMLQPVSWQGVPPDTPRTWIRPLKDAIQSAEMQQQLIAACGATDVIDIDSDHTPARSRPHELARLLDGIAALYDDPRARLVPER
jgi:pimeloyl-ACP methyl ester carboxylesterase